MGEMSASIPSVLKQDAMSVCAVGLAWWVVNSTDFGKRPHSADIQLPHL